MAENAPDFVRDLPRASMCSAPLGRTLRARGKRPSWPSAASPGKGPRRLEIPPPRTSSSFNDCDDVSDVRAREEFAKRSEGEGEGDPGSKFARMANLYNGRGGGIPLQSSHSMRSRASPVLLLSGRLGRCVAPPVRHSATDLPLAGPSRSLPRFESRTAVLVFEPVAPTIFTLENAVGKKAELNASFPKHSCACARMARF